MNDTRTVAVETYSSFKISHISSIPDCHLMHVRKLLAQFSRRHPRDKFTMDYTKLNKPGLVIKYSFLIFCLVFLVRICVFLVSLICSKVCVY